MKIPTLMTTIAKNLCIFIICFATSGCSLILGIKNPKYLSDKEISKASTTLKIPDSVSYKLDKEYLNFILSLDTSKYKEERNNHYQPLQALYFDNSGSLKKFYVNCYAGGLPLKWNRNGNLNAFLPKDQAPVDTILSLTKQCRFLRKVGNTASTFVVDSSVDFYVFIYWNKFMFKHSKRLIKHIQENCLKAQNFKVQIVYVNNDNLFVDK